MANPNPQSNMAAHFLRILGPAPHAEQPFEPHLFGERAATTCFRLNFRHSLFIFHPHG